MSLKRYLIKKSVATIQAEAKQTSLNRTLGKWNLLSLGIGCIIGAGIFVMTGTAAATHAGPAIVLSFVLAAFACGFAGLCYAELASILPISGSAYTYAYATLGEVFAWVMGWLLVLEYGLASATVSVGWSGYLVSFLNDFGIVIPPEFTRAYGEIIKLDNGETVKAIFNAPAAIGIFLVTTLLIAGISESAKVNNVIVFIKVAVIVAFVIIGAFYVDPSNWSPFIPPQLVDESGNPIEGAFGYSGILRAASIIFFAYIGFEAISTAAQEAKDPQKDMPFGIIGALLVCTVLYIMVSGVLTGIVNYEKLNVADPMAVAVDEIGLGWFAFLIKVGALMGLSSVMLVLIYGQTRIFYIISRDGLLPKVFCVVHKKFHTPHLNTMIVGLVVALAAGLTPLKMLGDLVSLGTLSAFTIVCFSVLYLRYTQPDIERPFRTPWVPFVPLMGIAFCGYLIYGMFTSHEGEAIFEKLKWFLLMGAAIYIFYGQFHSKLAKGERHRKGDEEFIKREHEIHTE